MIKIIYMHETLQMMMDRGADISQIVNAGVWKETSDKKPYLLIEQSI